MHFRSASSPVLKTFGYPLSTPDIDLGSPNILPTRPVSMCLRRATSEGEIKRIAIFSKCSCMMSPVLVKEKDDMNVCIINETMSALLHDISLAVVEETEEEKMVCLGGGDGGICDGKEGGGDGSNGGESMDVHYQNMIKAYPCDPLILANYVKFLKEVRGEAVKAEKMCEKAILENGNTDGNVLSMYGQLIWNNHKDGDRAKIYFEQALQSSPDDCFVLASYAYFLWDAGEDDNEENGQKESQFINSLQTCTNQPHILPYGRPPLAAA